MLREDLGVYLAIISSGRPQAVPAVEGLVGSATWFVGTGEEKAYREACASSVVEGGKLCSSRNHALQVGWQLGAPVVELSDDLKKIEQIILRDGKAVAVPMGFAEAVCHVGRTARSIGARLGGVAPTSNLFYYNPRKPTHTSAFIVGDFIYVESCGLLFDEAMRLKEDYDYTLQHLRRFGAVARCDDVLAHFTHRSNAGGAVAYRTPDVEQEAIAYLRAKWGAVIQDNPRRPNEILLKIPRRRG